MKKRDPKLNDLISESTMSALYYFMEYICENNCYDTATRYELTLKRMPFLKNVSDETIAEYLGCNRTTINLIKNSKKNKKNNSPKTPVK
jgi:hypothetical protein